MLKDMEANLTLDSLVVDNYQDIVVKGEIMNKGSTPVNINLQIISSPSLSLKLRKVGGSEIPLLPPPIPKQENNISLLPGQKYLVVYQNFLNKNLLPGEYEISICYKCKEFEFHSKNVRFRFVLSK